MNDIDYKKLDKERVIAILKGKAQVDVADLLKNPDIEKLRVYPILSELVFDGRVRVVKEHEKGAPAIVSWIA